MTQSLPPLFPLRKTARLSAQPDGFKTLDLRVETELPIAPHPGSFAWQRRNHVHEGVDLYGIEGDEVLAMEDGVVVFNGPFTGPKAGFEFWLDTDAVAVEGASGALFYGEIEVGDWPVGSVVRRGDVLGRLARVLKKDKGRPLHMLHLELYQAGARESCGIWPLGAERPAGLLDPTPMIAGSLGIEPPAPPPEPLASRSPKL